VHGLRSAHEVSPLKPVDKRKHHYVPQFLLRNFASAKRETLYAFDKWDGKQFQVAIKDAAAERGYNSFETDEASGCAEEYFTQIETTASPFIQEIVSDRRLPALAPEGGQDRFILPRGLGIS
jgi:hypothetical protein